MNFVNARKSVAPRRTTVAPIQKPGRGGQVARSSVKPLGRTVQPFR
jgi:hypothetical protein